MSRYPRALLISILLLVPAPIAGQHTGPGSADLMPLPNSVEWGQGYFGIEGSFSVTLTGHRDDLLVGAVDRLYGRIEKITGLRFPARRGQDAVPAGLVIHCRTAGARDLSWDEDESYQLTVTSERALLEAETPVGVLRGMETFLQLVQTGRGGFAVPAVYIQDEPRFPWRGLLIDSCRHWLPPEVIKRNLDGMAAVKMNVLHWHLSEDQGFRVESRRYPRLHEMGSEGEYYTQEDIREIVAYARDRGIRVVPEFDMPGHATSWFAGYPELASAPGPYAIKTTWGVHDPAMDPARRTTYRFLDRFITEMTRLFPDAYFHIGGDEVNGKQWDANPEIQEFMRKEGMEDNHDLQVYFNQQVLRILEKGDRKMVGWDEILHPDLPPDAVIQSWRGQRSLARAAREGRLCILSSGWYLDHILPAGTHYLVDPLGGEAAELTPDEAAFVLGGEACMWSEFVTAETVDSRIWPRTAAIAERLWSPAEVNDEEDMYRRLSTVDRYLEWLGLQHRSNYEPMLRRLAGREDITYLKAIVDILEPVRYYQRPATGNYTTWTPLNRVVDAARPESMTARQFVRMVDEYLSVPDTSRAAVEDLNERLTRWQLASETLLPLLEGSEVLSEIIPVVDSVRELVAAGLEALEYLRSGMPAGSEWLEDRLQLIEAASEPRAEVHVRIVEPVGRLIRAAAGGR